MARRSIGEQIRDAQLGIQPEPELRDAQRKITDLYIHARDRDVEPIKPSAGETIEPYEERIDV